MTATEKAEVMIGFDHGKKVQCKPIGSQFWVDNNDPQWAWDRFEYRLKPELIECWVAVMGGKLMPFAYRDKDSAQFGFPDAERLVRMVEAPE